ncbi:unnamed protein product [Darwinula stevensoni]|uniref:Uncharacterized protein n=1 Tax=Darwinula stevensoni TaxID=69355 RepID=A0A7R9A1C3_9CRUS|nr:unnamed protein product [Darwinula stevensoni]CAG0887442.1 unnamed protein product [Darwinula stevensoni]
MDLPWVPESLVGFLDRVSRELEATLEKPRRKRRLAVKPKDNSRKKRWSQKERWREKGGRTGWESVEDAAWTSPEGDALAPFLLSPGRSFAFVAGATQDEVGVEGVGGRRDREDESRSPVVSMDELDVIVANELDRIQQETHYLEFGTGTMECLSPSVQASGSGGRDREDRFSQLSPSDAAAIPWTAGGGGGGRCPNPDPNPNPNANPGSSCSCDSGFSSPSPASSPDALPLALSKALQPWFQVQTPADWHY